MKGEGGRCIYVNIPVYSLVQSLLGHKRCVVWVWGIYYLFLCPYSSINLRKLTREDLAYLSAYLAIRELIPYHL